MERKQMCRESGFASLFFSLCFCPGYFCDALLALSRAAVNFSHVVAYHPVYLLSYLGFACAILVWTETVSCNVG